MPRGLTCSMLSTPESNRAPISCRAKDGEDPDLSEKGDQEREREREREKNTHTHTLTANCVGAPRILKTCALSLPFAHSATTFITSEHGNAIHVRLSQVPCL